MSIKDRHFDHVEETFADALDTMLAKNHDYSDDDNPYSNFEFGADAAGITVEQGLLFIIGIKMARLKQLLVAGKEPAVEESVEDTLKDTINYTAILKSFRALASVPPAVPVDDIDFDAALDGYDEEPDYLGELPEQDPVAGPNWFTRFLTTRKAGAPSLFEKV